MPYPPAKCDVSKHDVITALWKWKKLYIIIVQPHRIASLKVFVRLLKIFVLSALRYISSTETETERLDAEDMSYVRFVTCVVQRTQLVPEICQASPVVQVSRIGKLALHSHGT